MASLLSKTRNFIQRFARKTSDFVQLDYAAQLLGMAATTLRSCSRWQRLRCVVAQDGSDYAA